MITKSVTVSGSVGKQVYAITANPIVLKGMILTPSGANATLTIRDGNASGNVEYFIRAMSAHGSIPINLDKHGQRFDKGMHVKVIGTAATCYLLVE